MSMVVIDKAVVQPDTPYVLQGDGKTYRLDRSAFEAALQAAEAASDNQSLITTGEAAEILQMSARTVARILDAGRLPFFRNGQSGRRMVAREDVLAYRDAQMHRKAHLQETRDLADNLGLYDIDPASLPLKTR